MWRTGVVTALFLLHIIQSESASIANAGSVQRLKRSAHYYDCPPQHPPPFWPPPPPPPPYWPPAPPPPPPPPPPPQPSIVYYQQPNEAYTADAQAQSESTQDVSQQKPCDSCHGNQNTATSNAQSDSGSAVAIAIARAHKDN